MQFRKRTISGIKAWIIVAIFLFLIVSFVCFVIGKSLDVQSTIGKLLTNNLIADFVAGIVTAIIAFVVGWRKGFPYWIPAWNDTRKTMNAEDLNNSFQTDSSCQ